MPGLASFQGLFYYYIGTVHVDSHRLKELLFVGDHYGVIVQYWMLVP